MIDSAIARQMLKVLSGTATRRRLAIFTYHRVLDAIDPLVPDEPTAQTFERQMAWISEYLTVVALPDASKMLEEKRLPPGAACITFDDGYRNNYEIALPILERFRLPATFFIATGAIADGAMWNDLIIESVRRCGGRLDLTRFGHGVHLVDTVQRRPEIVTRVLDAMKYLPVDERANQAREIYRLHCGAGVPSLMMTPEMIADLANRGFDVGAHTMTHPILAKVDDARASAEVEGSRNWLQSVTGRRPLSFAYPNGREEIDFNSTHRAMVRRAGFSCAVSTTWGCASPPYDLMSLPRFTPWERTRARFFTRIAKTYAQTYVSARRPGVSATPRE